MPLFFSLMLALPAAEPQSNLAARLDPIIKAHKGKAAVGVKHLGTGESFFLNADEVMPTASLIKVAVLVDAYLQADEGKLSLRDPATLKESDKVPGSGILTYHFSEGASLPLRDCVRLMTAYSDNTATNLVLEKVGIANVNKRMAELGLKETRINAKVFRGSTTSVDPKRTAKYGLGSTTAREMVALFEKLQTGDGFRPPVKLAIIEHLKKNEDKDKFGRLGLPGVAVAHKDGSITTARTDAGILYTPSGPIVVCVLTDGNSDRRWVRDNAGNVLCADVARAVYEHFHQKKDPGK
jgi:D-alanyl-D-alanine carboxypeptidase (penicillin-binding protein 5/6)/beta-lactamase class A